MVFLKVFGEIALYLGFMFVYVMFIFGYVGSNVNKDYPDSKVILIVLSHLILLCVIDDFKLKSYLVVGLLYTIYHKIFVEK